MLECVLPGHALPVALTEDTEPLAVPAQNRGWLHQQDGVAPSRHQAGEQTVAAARTRRRNLDSTRPIWPSAADGTSLSNRKS